MNILKKMQALLKEAGVPMPEQAGDEHPLKVFAAKLAQATAAYGDGAGLAADHPLHALKALEKEMNDVMASATAKAAADKEAADKLAAAPKEEDDDVNKAAIATEVNKALEPMQKALAAAEKRAADAETIAKSEQGLREVEVEKTVLRKFSRVTVDVEKDAPVLADLRKNNKPAYDFMIAKLDAAEAVAKKAAVLEQDLGSPLGGAGQTAWAEIEAKAAELVTKDAKGLTIEKAIDRVMQQQPELVKRYKAEKAGAVS